MMKSEKIISNVSSVLGIIAFVGTIASAFLGETIAAYVLIGLTLLFWLIWLTIKVVSLTNLVQKISSETNGTTGNASIAGVDYRIDTYLEDAPLITGGDQSHVKVSSEFLSYKECTILINVLVSKENTGIRDLKAHKYILGHREIRNDHEINRFGLRYASNKKWEVVFSNSRAEPCYLSRDDALLPGWHQFMITWDLGAPRIVFSIDGGRTETSNTFRDKWPQHFADTVSVGAWKSSDPNSFVETTLADLWIINKHLKPNDSIVIKHKNRR